MTCSSGRVSPTKSTMSTARTFPPRINVVSLLVSSLNDHISLFFPHASSCETYRSTGPSVHLRYV